MAKYEVTFLCGHRETVELVGYRKERESKIFHMERTKVCQECYKKREENEHLKVCVEPLCNLDIDGDIQFCMWLTGNTMDIRESLKNILYRWSSRPSYMQDRKAYWHKIIKEQEIGRELVLLKETVEDVLVLEPSPARIKNYDIALKKKDRYEELVSKRLGEMPVPPELIDGNWNGKVYGTARNYSIYLDGERIPISNEEADEIKNYLEKLQEYQEEKARIRKEI